MTIEQLPLIMLRALALTILFECAAAYILGVRDKHGQIVVVLANILTNPLVVSIGAAVVVFARREMLLPVTLILEVMVVIVEGTVYSKKLVARCDPFVLSLACNMVSYCAGEMLNRLVF